MSINPDFNRSWGQPKLAEMAILISMKLIGSLTSPYVRKVRIVFLEKKVDVDLELENVWAADTKIALNNPLGKVPCLILDDGEAIYDSRVIAEYVDTLSPVGKLIPAGSRERATVKTWEALADGVDDAGILARLEVTLRPTERQSSEWLERQMGKIDAALAQMSRELGENAWCHGNQMTLADIAVGCALGYMLFRFPNVTWQAQYPNLDALYQKLMQRPSFAETAPPAA
jgi:glutathione S-transferase